MAGSENTTILPFARLPRLMLETLIDDLLAELDRRDGDPDMEEDNEDRCRADDDNLDDDYGDRWPGDPEDAEEDRADWSYLSDLAHLPVTNLFFNREGRPDAA